jgi:phosphoenolpyruvate-protein phosphotransferase (PTS system enzyme I)
MTSLSQEHIHTSGQPPNDAETENSTVIIHGIAASPGLAHGPVFVLEKKSIEIHKYEIKPAGVDEELERLNRALVRAEKELTKILSYTQQKIGNTKAKIFEAQIMILNDPMLMDQVRKRIRKECLNVESAVHEEMTRYQEMLQNADESYLRERAGDIEDVKHRIIRSIQQERLLSKFEGRAIIVAPNLSPADTILLSRNEVLGYATDGGGITSHTALLARALKIPAVVGLTKISRAAKNGDEMLLDGYSGTAILRPKKGHIDHFEEKRRRYTLFEEKLSVFRDLPAETKDGKRIILAANADLEEELDFVGFQGAEGIGLYRSESILMGKDTFPQEEEQYEAYWYAAEKVYPHDLIVRVFDIGGDKLFPKMVEENNPFLGWRGIRILLDRPEMFKQQLRALLRASVKKNVKILLPMISGVGEVLASLKIIDEVKEDLRNRNVAFDENIAVGAMIEVPGAAIMAREIARNVDFFSIGTNDLIQYLLAVDRGNPTINKLFQEFHPAVLRMIKHTIDAGHKRNVWVGMCGEMAGDPIATILLVGMGIDELSVVPSVLPEVKKIIRSISSKEAQIIARRALSMGTPEEVHEYLRRTLKAKLPDVPLG